MNALLWLVQIALAVLSLSGGTFKLFMFEQVAAEAWYGALPRGGWAALGVFEILCGVFLLVPAVMKRMAALTPLAAAALALESLGLSILYAQYSLALTAANPLVWTALMTVMAAAVAYGRHARGPANS